jgi:hypothetical protein
MGRAEVEQVETDHDLTQEKLKEILLRRRFLPVYSRDGGFFFVRFVVIPPRHPFPAIRSS